MDNAYNLLKEAMVDHRVEMSNSSTEIQSQYKG